MRGGMYVYLMSGIRGVQVQGNCKSANLSDLIPLKGLYVHISLCGR